MSDMSDAHISSCLNYLSRELDPLLTRLVVEKGLMSQSQVKEYGWTAILWYLDDQRNRNVELSRYNPRDIQVQLRMLTEPVGTSERKHPFEPDSSRTVSTYAQDLRIFRNKKMHYMEMDRNDAVRIYDSAARLFEALGAPEQKAWCESQLNRVHAELFGAGEAAPVRRELDEEVRQATSAARSSKTEVSAPRGAFTRPARPAPVPKPAQPAAPASVAQPAPVSDSSPAPLCLAVGEGRYPFEPWEPISLGDRDIFDSLRSKRSKEQMSAALEEIVSAEGPVQADRLATLAAQCFGVSRLVKKNRDWIIRLADRMPELRVDEHKFVWHVEEPREEYGEFRPSVDGAVREFDQISPVEIANAWRFYEQNPELMDEGQDVESAVLATFGRKRRTAKVKAQLELAKALLAA
ncbi:DUF3320 domain-containing protein [Rothia mucilaginosa]|uniref:DUF3320 domain-containing protein n=1 Tax=Rothia mucilaginosa TaxID=43675 RepID=UPI0026F12150|nr:DUF3320 domain-containing protein [Rothia mucilaginosa]